MDGVEDRRRTLAKAHDCLSLGLGFLAQYRDGQKHVDARRDALFEAESKLREEDILADDVGSGKALEPYLELWNSGREVELSVRDVEHAYSRAVQAPEQCLEMRLDLRMRWQTILGQHADAKKTGERAKPLYFRARRRA